ncbi:piggyBac transposable element-derived protein 4-like [Centruroides sculpturatus]|uniref:piggyBac transposable element-derived protein 4-like n=1 Tax=Centruroides sculpturatus TaxID=218467 RepID=UPI000C6DC9BA|nr:piggyBac transposable element-derived protein 4-like [Centruroides sculpturatus]
MAQSSSSKRPRRQAAVDTQQLLKWLEEEEDEQELGDLDESDEGEVDVLTTSDHETDTEQEMDEEDEDQTATNARYYIGKDGFTKWNKQPPPKRVRTRSQNIITHLPGPKNEARNCTTEIDIFNLFFSINILNAIVKYTNIYISKVRNLYVRDRDARDTNSTEIKAFVGLLYLIGTIRSSTKNAHKMWDNSKGNGLESCYLSMSEKRFRFLLRCIRFDDITDREERRKIDKLAPIREIHEMFLTNFQKYFTPSEYLTVDEQLLAFRGKCSFRQYIPSKPAKYGIKMFALCDVKTAYTVSLEPYLGKQPDGPYCFSTNAQDVVERLVTPVQGTNRNITGDNWFTSVSLVKALKAKKLTYVGTIRKNRREVPAEFLYMRNRALHSSIFGFESNCTMVSYCPKKNKAVLLISSMHFDDKIDESTGQAQKPEIITFYNMTKTGVDVVDQLCERNNVARITRRWPMVMFFNLLNIAAINTFVIYKYHKFATNETCTRYDFLEMLSWELIKTQIEHRSNIASLPKDLRNRASKLLKKNTNVQMAPQSPPSTSQGRCYICPRSSDKKSKRWCKTCKKWICSQHQFVVCQSCYDK